MLAQPSSLVRVERHLRFAVAALALVATSAEAATPSASASAVPAPSNPLDEVLAPLERDKLFTTALVGAQLVDLRTGEEVWSYKPDSGLIPASTMKMVTAAAALHDLGPAYRFDTEILVGGEIDGTGVLKGNLYVRGHGDPTMVVERLWKLVQDLKLEGINRIEGDIVFDESFLAPDYALPGWDKRSDIEEGPSYFPSLGALSVNTNSAALVVGPGPEIGKPARVVLETPAWNYIEIDNQVTTGAERSRSVLDIDRSVEDDGHLKFTVTGSVPAGNDTERYYRSITDPTAHFIGVFHDLVRSSGIEVVGKYRKGTTPDAAEMLLETRSQPLSQILADMNKYSYNFYAELVLRALGAEQSGGPGTTAAGIDAVSAYLTSIGVGSDEYHIVNGSGLSRDAWMHPTVLTAVLMDMANDRKVGSEFYASLSIAGEDGTLWRRLREEPARMRGKTGTLDGVHCLAGYLEGTDGARYAFAFMVNGDRATSAASKALHDRFARQVLGASATDSSVADEGGDEE